jgi:hypothetical protein
VSAVVNEAFLSGRLLGKRKRKHSSQREMMAGKKEEKVAAVCSVRVRRAICRERPKYMDTLLQTEAQQASSSFGQQTHQRIENGQGQSYQYVHT